MSRSASALRASHHLAVPAVLLTLLVAGPAAAQGTMTPTQPPSAATGTPNQPPATPTQPPPVAPAQPAQPTASNPSPAGAAAQTSPVEAEEKSDAPKARTGFQMALRTGVQVPLGDATGENNAALSDLVGVQIPLTMDIGGKIIPQLFIGGYLGLSFGGAGGRTKEACDKGSVDCSAFGGRIGAQIQYHFIPEGRTNPWIGYGIGYELLGLTLEKGSIKQTYAAAGVEFAHLMAGVDFRLTRGFGIGPFADFALGQYSVFTVQNNGKDAGNDGEIEKKAMHQWLTIGAKFTFFP